MNADGTGAQIMVTPKSGPDDDADRGPAAPRCATGRAGIEAADRHHDWA